MTLIREWTRENEALFANAVCSMQRCIDYDGDSFGEALRDTADLYSMDEDALRAEWNLRMCDAR
jgi:hypothetical protein